MSMIRFMVHAHASDADASIAFYEKLGFTVAEDDRDGEGTRCVRMSHPESPGALLNLKCAPYLVCPTKPESALEAPLWPVVFSLVVAEFYEWGARIKAAGLSVEHEIREPWGAWIHLRDPDGNLVCVTNRDLY